MVPFSVLTDIYPTFPVFSCPEAASAAPIMVEQRAENILASTSGGVLESIRRPSIETMPQAFICPTCKDII